LRAEGVASDDVVRPQTDNAIWAAASTLGRLRAEVGGGLGFEAEAGLVIPLVRHDFVYLEPTSSIYRVPALALAGGLGVCLHFP
jgi:hypothetical protein